MIKKGANSVNPALQCFNINVMIQCVPGVTNAVTSQMFINSIINHICGAINNVGNINIRDVCSRPADHQVM